MCLIVPRAEADEIESIQRKKSRSFVESLSKRRSVSFAKLFPDADEAAIDLLEKLLCFDPDKRYTVEQVLN